MGGGAVDMSMDHPFEQLEWDAQQWDGPVALRVVLGLIRFRETDGSCLEFAPDFGDFTSFQTGRHILIGRGDKWENFDLIFSPLLKHGKGY